MPPALSYLECRGVESSLLECPMSDVEDEDEDEDEDSEGDDDCDFFDFEAAGVQCLQGLWQLVKEKYRSRVPLGIGLHVCITSRFC